MGERWRLREQFPSVCPHVNLGDERRGGEKNGERGRGEWGKHTSRARASEEFVASGRVSLVRGIHRYCPLVRLLRAPQVAQRLGCRAARQEILVDAIQLVELENEASNASVIWDAPIGEKQK